MRIDDLAQVLAPPNVPVETPSKDDWLATTQRLGVALPDDYVSFVSQFGTGCIDGFLWVFNPVAGNQYVNLHDCLDSESEAFAYSKDRGFAYRPLEPFPERPGLIPCAATDNGDALYWIVQGEPNTWSVAVGAARGPSFEVFELSLVPFLCALLSGTIRCSVFPEGFPSDAPRFEPPRSAAERSSPGVR